jgi:hypothetical protein
MGMTGFRPRRRRRAGEPPAALALGSATLALGGGATLGAALLPERAPARRRMRGAGRPPPPVRGLYAAAGLLALSVLLDSAIEHDRGSFKNPGMLTPLLASGATLGAAALDAAAGPARGRRAVYATAAAVGAAGVAFHAFNILKRPGKANWANLFYAAPIGAPAALSLAGGLGLAAGAVARGWRGAGRKLCGFVAAGLAGTVGEVSLLHFRGSFQNPFMWVPVALPPVGAALLAGAAAEADRRPHPLARAWLALTAVVGLAGVGFHVFGVSRAMGGWRNWRQNVVDGPPIPAPPAFTALSIAGLAALALSAAEAS